MSNVKPENSYNIGDVIGLKKILKLYRRPNGRMSAETQCILCGKISHPYTSDLKNPKLQSCICQTITHGMTRTRIYSIYANMKYRCYNPNQQEYHNYGGKGIIICDEWLGKNGFSNFYQWAMANGYKENLTIDRINENGNYEPNNCQWITLSDNVIKANKTKQHRKSNNGDYYGISPTGEYYEFSNAAEFGRNHNLDGTEIRGKANGHIKNRLIHGWDFGYVKNKECLC